MAGRGLDGLGFLSTQVPELVTGKGWTGVAWGICFCSCFCHAVYEKSWGVFGDLTLLMTPMGGPA